MTAKPATVSELHDKAEAIAEKAPLLAHPSLAAALVAALADLTVVEAARSASIDTKTGGNYSYKYADIADVVKLTRPHLANHGLIALTPVHDHGDGLACTVTLLHTSGERLDLGPFPFPHGKDAQATGSMVTYHRRYALVAALGMAAGDDDDGATAKARGTARRNDPPEPTISAEVASHVADLVVRLDALRERGEVIRQRLAQPDMVGHDDLLGVIRSDEGWRNWVTQAVEAAEAKAAASSPTQEGDADG